MISIIQNKDIFSIICQDLHPRDISSLYATSKDWNNTIGTDREYIYKMCKPLKEEVVKEYYGDGYYGGPLMVIKRYNKFGQNHGKFEGFYENGNLKYVKHFENGKPKGKWLSWFPNGWPRYEENYVDGKLHGERIEYTPDGEIIREYYIDGISTTKRAQIKREEDKEKERKILRKRMFLLEEESNGHVYNKRRHELEEDIRQWRLRYKSYDI